VDPVGSIFLILKGETDVKLVRKVQFFFINLIGYIYVPMLYLYAWFFGELRHLNREGLFVWLKAMLKVLSDYCKAAYNFRIHQVIRTFALSKIEIIKKTAVKDCPTPIVVLCVKNDISRIMMLVNHYRECGIERFAILDNYSDDGTYEWLEKQHDVDLYRTKEKYQTAVKEGWINRLVSHYGFDRWYIITDSDELLTWIGMESHNINEVITYAEKNGIKRFKGLTLDTYTRAEVYQETSDIKKDYRYIDTDSYWEKEIPAGTKFIKQYYGGPRNRLMGVIVPLSKYPLSYFEKGTVSVSAHYLFPVETEKIERCYIGILHYKFIDKDLDEFRKRANNDSGFSSNGRHYKKIVEYFEGSGQRSFMYDGSLELKSSMDLSNVMYIEEIAFNEND